MKKAGIVLVLMFNLTFVVVLAGEYLLAEAARDGCRAGAAAVESK